MIKFYSLLTSAIGLGFASIGWASSVTLSQTLEHPRFNTLIQVELEIDEESGNDSLKIEYRSDLDYCFFGGDIVPPELHVQFQLGTGEQSQLYSYPMAIGSFCSRDKTAILEIDSVNGFTRMFQPWDNDPQAWEKIFPLTPEGTRWYAMKISVIRSQQGTGIVVDQGDTQGYEIVFD